MDSNNDLITKMWGPHFWISLHSVTFGYPQHPTSAQKKSYKNYFKLVADVLPCHYCRDSYKKLISSGSTVLNDKVLSSRESLTKWLYNVHKAVNKKLGVDYNIPYEELVKRYEAYRASCSVQTEESHEESQQSVVTEETAEEEKGCVVKSESNLPPITNIKDAPVISVNLAEYFVDYAKMRGVSQYEMNIKNLKDRNKECMTIMNHMKINKIPSVEKDGRWEGLPTIEELRLILRLCSNLSSDKLSKMIKKLPYEVPDGKIYKLITR